MCADSARFTLQTLAKKPDTSFHVTGSPRYIQSILKTCEWYNYISGASKRISSPAQAARHCMLRPKTGIIPVMVPGARQRAIFIGNANP